MQPYRTQIDSLRQVGADFHRRGWSLATSSNYSLVVNRDPFRLLITASGQHKGELSPEDFVVVDGVGRPTEPDAPRPSAETLLHTVVASSPNVGAVLHTHSVWATLVSQRPHERGYVEITGLEMIKGLEGVEGHKESVRIRVFDNSQDIPELAGALQAEWSAENPALRHGFLLRGHGLYTWGRNLTDARRHVEALEFLFEVTERT
jgi:methylthioribulose-1-phosphate dehydratase